MPANRQRDPPRHATAGETWMQQSIRELRTTRISMHVTAYLCIQPDRGVVFVLERPLVSRDQHATVHKTFAFKNLRAGGTKLNYARKLSPAQKCAQNAQKAAK
jgi:hypothetical protein